MRKKIAVMALYGILTVLVTYPGIRHMQTGYIGSGADPELFMWFMKWVAHSITHMQNPLASNYIMYPDGVNLMWNTAIFLVSVVMTPITSLFGVLFSYNVVVLLGLTLSAFTAFLASRRFLQHDWAAALAGAIYGFSPYMMAQSLGHMHLTQAYIVPLLLWLGYDIFVTQKMEARKSGICLGILLAGQMLVAEEVFASAIIMGLSSIAVLLLIFQHEKQVLQAKYKYVRKVSWMAAAVLAVLILPFMIFQFYGPWQPGPGRLQAANVYVTDFLNFIIPGPLQLLKTPGTDAIASQFTGNGAEWNAYLGLPFILIFIFTLQQLGKNRRLGKKKIMVKRKQDLNVKLLAREQLLAGNQKIMFLTAMTVIAGVWSLGPFLHVAGFDTHISMPWRFFGSMPLLEHLLPCRFGLYIYLFMAVIIAGFAEIMSQKGRISKIVAWGTIALGLVFYAPRLPYPVTYPDLPAFFSDEVLLAEIPEESAAFVVPVSYGGQGTAMLWQAMSGMRFKMPEGYAIGTNGFEPPRSILLDTLKELQSGKQVNLSEVDSLSIHSYMKSAAIRTVIVGPVNNEDNIVEFFNNLLNVQPNIKGGVYCWQIDS